MCLCDEGYEGDNCTPNLCVLNSVSCGDHGDCDPTSGECQCDSGFYGPVCAFDPSTEYLDHGVICDSDTDVLTAQGQDNEGNAYTLTMTVEANTFDRCTLVSIAGSQIDNADLPDGILPVLIGNDFSAHDEEKLKEGVTEDVPLLKPVRVCLSLHRLSPVTCPAGQSCDFVYDPAGADAIEVSDEGMCFYLDHFSFIGNVNTEPVTQVTCPDIVTEEKVVCDYTGTKDEKSGSHHFMSYLAKKDDATLARTAVPDPAGDEPDARKI